MDMRVGKIVEIHKNPNKDHLYNEKIDIGNGEVRSIASGLVNLIPIDQMEGALCVVLCNLKARKLGEWLSHGMVLCAETPDRSVAELLVPPPGSLPGDVITFAGFERKPPAELNPKKNPWDNVAPKLKINSEGVAVYENIPFTTDKGVVTSKNIRDGEIY
jgi:tRNA-binding EMAP/Myf-like protein